MCEDNMETIVIEVDAELLEQLNEVIRPMGLTPEMLVKQFIEWCVAPDRKSVV